MKNILMVLPLAIALSAAAAEPATKAGPEPVKPKSFTKPNTMCNTTYALCIKAPCAKIRDANNLFPCECVMQTGWNMGPNSCDDRAKNLTSTYSNNFNDGMNLLSCPAPTDWAWCYGAKCEKNPKDPTGQTATCKCPVITSAALVLVKPDDCQKGNAPCRMLWSGALAAESKFANDYYWWWMVTNGHAGETDPPAQPCPPVDYKK